MTSKDRDVQWYVQNRGLATGGIDVTTLTDDDIPIAEIEALFDKKSSKNGYRYDKEPEREVVASILELYRRVTGKTRVLNSELNLCFARGVVAWLKGQVLDWAKYAVYCNKYATALRNTKSANRELKGQVAHKGEPPAAKCGRRPPLTGKQSNQENFGSSHVKMEGRTVKASFMPLKGSKSGCPNWKEEEILEVGDLLNTLKQVLIGAREDVRKLQEQHADDAANCQVCNMRLEGRQKVYLDSQSQRLEMVKELNDLVRKYEHQGEGAQDIGVEAKVEDQALGLERIISVFGAQQLPTEICDVQQRLEWATNNDKVAFSMLNVGQQECEKANKKVATALETLKVKQQRVVDLGSQILCVAQQWEKMKEGTGSCFYPQPAIRSHEDLSGENHVLTVNNCPICGHGFEVNDILVGSCGHTYHPICMNWHTKTSLCCKVAHCQRQFHPDWLLSIGVRPILPQPNVQDHQCRRKMLMKKLIEACPKVETMQPGLQVFPKHVMEKNPDSLAMMVLDSPKIEGWTNWDEQPILDSFVLGTGMTDAPNISSSVGSKYDSSIQRASPATFSVTKSNESYFVASANGVTRSCLICEIKSPNIKFQVFGHSQYCYDCFTQAVPTCCPVCSTLVDGWSKMPVSEVTSPLRHNTQARGVIAEAIPAKPPISLKLNLSSAFDALVIPQLEDIKPKLIATQNPKPIGIEIFGQKETLLDEHSDRSDSDDDCEQGLVHYPPRPVIHREAKHVVPISFTSDESGSEGEGFAQGDITPAARTCEVSKDRRSATNAISASAAISTIVKVEKEGSTADLPSMKVEDDIRHTSQVSCSNLKKPRRNPLQPNPECQKRVTHGEAIDLGVEKVKKKRKKNRSVPVKNFNSFS